MLNTFKRTAPAISGLDPPHILDLTKLKILYTALWVRDYRLSSHKRKVVRIARGYLYFHGRHSDELHTYVQTFLTLTARAHHEAYT